MKRRLVIVRMSIEVAAQFVTTGTRRRLYVEGVPEDVKMIGAALDYDRRTLLMTFEHESFAEVEDGALLPEKTIRVTVFNDEVAQ